MTDKPKPVEAPDVTEFEFTGVIETLEDLLERARKQEIFGIAIVTVESEGVNGMFTSGLAHGYRHRILSGLTELAVKVSLDQMEEDE